MSPFANSEGEHSAILLTFIKLPFVNKIFVLSITYYKTCLKSGQSKIDKTKVLKTDGILL